MAQVFISDVSISQAVEIAKAGMPMTSGSLISSPDAVAKFLEIVATKLENLRNPQR